MDCKTRKPYTGNGQDGVEYLTSKGVKKTFFSIMPSSFTGTGTKQTKLLHSFIANWTISPMAGVYSFMGLTDPYPHQLDWKLLLLLLLLEM